MNRRRLLAAIVSAVMAATMMPAASFGEEKSEDNNYADNQLLVVYDKESDCTQRLDRTDFAEGEAEQSRGVDKLADSTAEQLSEDADISVDGGEFVTGSTASEGAMLRVELDSKQDMNDAIEAIEEQDDVAYVQKNYYYQVCDEDMKSLDNAGSGDMQPLGTVSDTELSSQYYLNSWSANGSARGANIASAWDLTRSEGKVSVAVIDTGIDTDHPDLAANIDMEHSRAIVGTLDDASGHGTMVAGVISAVADNSMGIAGTSYNAEIIALNVFEKTSSGFRASTASMISALSYLEELVSTGQADNLRVINISSGQYEDTDPAFRECIKRLRENYNIITVCAGGNGVYASYPRTDNVYPADYEECVAVTALNKDGTNVEYSDYNKEKDISAPGKDIVSTMKGGGYGTASGTSLAAPVVSGALALLWAGNPELTADQAVESIRSTARPVNKSANDRGDKTGSSGALDCRAAYVYAMRTFKGEDLKYSISDETMSLGYTSCTYSGKAKYPSVKVGTLTQGKDYTVKYSGNTKVGTAYVTVTGAGIYEGSIKRTFRINPQGTSLKTVKRRYRGFRAYWYKRTTQTDGYQIQYSRYSNFKYSKSKYRQSRYNTRKVNKLTRKKYYYVRIRTYKKVNGITYYSSWSKSKRVKTR